MSTEDEISAAPGEPPEASERKLPLTHAAWADIRMKAEYGLARATELAAAHGITVSAISHHLKKHGIKFGSKAGEVATKAAEEAAKKAIEVASSFAGKRQTRIEETKEFYYQANKNIDTALMIRFKRMADAHPTTLPIEELSAAAKTAAFMKRALMIGRKERLELLDAEQQIDPNDIPELTIRDLTDAEIEKINSGEDDLDQDDAVIEEGALAA